MAEDWITDRVRVGPGLVKKNGVIDVNLADPRRSDPSLVVPVAHAYTHGVAGADPVTIAQSQVTDLIGDLADKVDTGDSRLSDARTPTAHHTSHELGGSDELALAVSQVAGLTAYIDALVAAIIPPWVESDIGKSLTVLSDLTLGWLDAGATVPLVYDSVATYDDSRDYDEGTW